MKKRNYPQQRRNYDMEFKRNALQMMSDGRSASSVSQALGVSEGLLYNWKSKAKAKAGKEKKEDSTQVKGLHKRLAEVEMERDILKKALSIFSRQT